MRTQAVVAVACLSILSTGLPLFESSAAGIESSLSSRSEPLHQVGPVTPISNRDVKFYGDFCTDCDRKLKRAAAGFLRRAAEYLEPTTVTKKRDLNSLEGAGGYFGDFSPDDDGSSKKRGIGYWGDWESDDDGSKKAKRGPDSLNPDIGYFGDFYPGDDGSAKAKRDIELTAKREIPEGVNNCARSDIYCQPGTLPDPTEPKATIPRTVKREADAKAEPQPGQFWGDFEGGDDEKKRDAEPAVTGMPIELPPTGKLCGSVDSDCKTEVVGGENA